MAGTIKVENNTAEPGSDIYPTGIDLDVRIETQRQSALRPDKSVSFSGLSKGRHTLNAHPLITGLKSAQADINVDEFKSYMSVAEAQGTRAELVGPSEARKLWPLIESERILGALFTTINGIAAGLQTAG